jgi:threonine dehydrogenase-like Zn-dependent dehydrogenase
VCSSDLELGAAAVVNYHAAAPDLASSIRSAVCRDGACAAARGFATVVEASGSAKAMEAALELAAPQGKVLILGDYGQARAAFPWNTLLHKELELVGSNASALGWPEAVRLATEPGFPLGRLVSARLRVDRFADALATVRARGDPVKVVVEWA